MSLDPNPYAKDYNDHPIPAESDRPIPAGTGPADPPVPPEPLGPVGLQVPLVEPGAEPIRTLLWTAATYRPLEEVAALVSLLKRTGVYPDSGNEALRAAAVARPLDEVRQLVAMLNEPGHEVDEADTTLRAAAVGRSIEDVAQLVDILGADEAEARSLQGARAQVREPQAAPVTPPPSVRSVRKPLSDPGGHVQMAEPPRPAGPPSSTHRPLADTPGLIASFAKPAAARQPASFSPALRSVLRWPAAAALFVVAVIHLPTDFTGIRAGGYGAVLPLIVTALCLVVAAWLAMQDTLWIWAAGAAAAVGVVALHALSGFGATDLLAYSLGDAFTAASAVAVVAAVFAAVLAGSALLGRQKAVGATTDA